MSDVKRTPLVDSREYSFSNLSQPQWIQDFTELLADRAQGTDSEKLLQPKPGAEATVRHFAADFIPDEAISIAQIAHIAELLYHKKQGPTIQRDLHEALYSSEAEPENLAYIEAIITDLPVIADFARKHHAASDTYGQEFVDIEGLVDLVEHTNLESLIIKAALDYSNFLLLDQQDSLTEKEQQKMRRIITTIKTIDAPVLELTGFDALATEMLSKAYEWELHQSGDEHFVDVSHYIFDQLGGRNELGKTTERIMNELFPEDNLSHEQVTRDQESYEIYFGDGTTTLPDNDTTYRILARLKSVGATAKKLHRTYSKQGELKMPADIVGLTLIAPDNQSIEDSIRYVMNQLPKEASYIHAPNRKEILHIKGSKEFVEYFTKEDGVIANSDLSLKKEICNNGYEAVKVAFLYPINDMHIPVEIQFTHEESRRQSRVGLGSHTLFKLNKLIGHGKRPAIKLSDEDLAEQLSRISQRKELIRNDRYVVNESSLQRAEVFRNPPRLTTATLACVALNA